MRRVEPAVLGAVAESAIEALGAPPAVARGVAESLVDADLRGHGSHGVRRLPMYREMVAGGAIDPAAEPTVRERTGPTAHVDGNDAFGQYVGRRAVEAAVDRAESHGVGVVGIRDATHLGRLGEWAERAASEEVVLLAVANTQGGALTVAPPGSAEPRLATNPLAFGVPPFDALPFPVVFDAATSQVANGKLRERRQAGESAPPAWSTDANGDGITDPDRVLDPDADGALRPLGGRETGHKGFGLAVAVELLAGLIGDGLVAGETDPEWFDNAGAFVAIDPLRFVSRETARHRVGTLAAHVRSAPVTNSVGESGSGRSSGSSVVLPGEPEHRTARERLETGIPLDETAVDSIRDLATDLGVEVPESLSL